MHHAELEALLKDLESDRIERKASLADGKKVCQAICAFANDLPDHRKPGVLFVGVNDDGSCSNLEVTDTLLIKAAGLARDGNILPIPSIKVEKQTLNGCELMVIVVEPASAPPVRYRGRIWVRVGPRRDVASIDDERRLSEKRIAKDLPFDARPGGGDLSDLNLDLFQKTYLPASLPADVLEQNGRSLEQQLQSLRMIDPGSQRATNLGHLVLGNDPRAHIPGAYIQFVRFDGRELVDPIIDQKEINGPISSLIRSLEEVLKSHISTALDATLGPVDVKRPDYPINALRQITHNAILHRSYEGTHSPIRISWFVDRIEIQSPGGPFGQVHPENFGQPGLTDYRNPNLAGAMKDLGFVQRFGMGIPMARNEMKKNGNPELEMIANASHVLVTLRARK